MHVIDRNKPTSYRRRRCTRFVYYTLITIVEYACVQYNNNNVTEVPAVIRISTILFDRV